MTSLVAQTTSQMALKKLTTYQLGAIFQQLLRRGSESAVRNSLVATATNNRAACGGISIIARGYNSQRASSFSTVCRTIKLLVYSHNKQRHADSLTLARCFGRYALKAYC